MLSLCANVLDNMLCIFTTYVRSFGAVYKVLSYCNLLIKCIVEPVKNTKL